VFDFGMMRTNARRSRYVDVADIVDDIGVALSLLVVSRTVVARWGKG